MPPIPGERNERRVRSGKFFLLHQIFSECDRNYFRWPGDLLFIMVAAKSSRTVVSPIET